VGENKVEGINVIWKINKWEKRKVQMIVPKKKSANEISI